MDQKQRYSRQTILPEIGEIGQDKITAASVLCVGAGGLGCPALLYLTAAGIGKIGIIDFDAVDETNLQRQVLFTVDQIGKNKALAAKERLSALNSYIAIQAYTEELTEKNIEELFNHYDIIIDGTDNFSTKFLINDAAVKTNTPFIYGSILGFDGQVSVFGADSDPCYRCLFPHPPKGHIPNCAEAGVIGAVAGIIGTTQAMEAIKIIVQHESFKPLTGKLWTIDMHSMENNVLSLPKDPDCPVCSKNKDTIHLEYTSPVCGIIKQITPTQVKTDKNAIIIDVRERNEWDAGHIDGAQHLALSDLINGNFPALDKEQQIILYCQKGQRSKQAAQLFMDANFQNIRSMIGGYENW